MSLALRSVRQMMLNASPGHVTTNAIKAYIEIIVELTGTIMRDARVLANNQGRKRVDAKDIKYAASHFIRR